MKLMSSAMGTQIMTAKIASTKLYERGDNHWVGTDQR